MDGKKLVYVTQRGNQSVAPILVFWPETGELYDSYGEDLV